MFEVFNRIWVTLCEEREKTNKMQQPDVCIVFLSVQYLNYISVFQLIALN